MSSDDVIVDKAPAAATPKGSQLLSPPWLTVLASSVVAAVVSGLFSLAQKRDELAQQYVATAVAVLSKDSGSEGLTSDQKELRRWACKLLNSKLDRDVQLDAKACQALSEGAAKLYGSGYTNILPTYNTGTSYPISAPPPGASNATR